MPDEILRLWPALAELRDLPEENRKQLLWFKHPDGSRPPEGVKLRHRLDIELGRLGKLELQAEAGTGEPQEQAIHQIKIVCKEFRSLIYESPTFDLYLDSYLCFNIRFAAGRFDNPRDPLPAEAAHKWNERPVGLPWPPDCEPEGGSTESPEAAAAHWHALVDHFLALKNSPVESTALAFLHESNPEQTQKFDLWLRRLLPAADDTEEQKFRSIAQGLYEWGRRRCEFYVDLERRHGRARRVESWLNQPRAEGAWHARNPLAARCGVFDVYWLARILRADVSPRGLVTFQDRSWLSYLAACSSMAIPKDDIRRLEDVLCAVFNYACELIQNAVDMAENCERATANPELFPKERASGSSDWRAVQDGEIEEIRDQRFERLVTEHTCERERPRGVSTSYWSKRIRTGEYEENLVGLAISGGGIRSATFALGVLQRLKDLDVLRAVDYLSTVSGGGYVGSWLLGNVRRTRYFLSRMTSWEESIAHLRNFSKYLAPQSGFLSADSWVIWATWTRNASLIQLTAIAWLWTSFVAALLMGSAFDAIAYQYVTSAANIVLAVSFVLVAVIIMLNIYRPISGRSNQHGIAVLLAWVGSFLSAALLWGESGIYDESYKDIFLTEYKDWYSYTGAALLLCMMGFAVVSLRREGKANAGSLKSLLPRLFGGALSAIVGAVIIYAGICAIRYVFDILANHNLSETGWYAYVIGPPLMLLAVTVAIVVFIGLIGQSSADWRREWWTRYGAWLAIFAVGFFGLSLVTVFGYVWTVDLWNYSKKASGALSATWVLSTIGGLLAGRSSKTKGEGNGSSIPLEYVAKIGGFVFIAGSVVLLSSALHFLLVHILVDHPSSWFGDLNALVWPPNRGMWLTFIILAGCGALFSWRFNLNIFGLNQFYRNRLVRCYLGATRWKPGLRTPDRFTGFDEKDDLRVTELQFGSSDYPGDPFRGPFPIVNCALNLGGSSDLSVKTRQSASFTITPLSAGSGRPLVGYVPVEEPEGSGGITLGQAVSISGAAASPNMGYNTSPLSSILLTMFNVRLAWWFPNPGLKKWQEAFSSFSIYYLLREFLGIADETSNYVNISDGGHFENLAIYELIRRRVKVIIASDGECDPDLAFGSLGNVIRICETDFGAKIDIDVTSLRKQPNGMSHAHCAVGKISYSNGSAGYLIYLKASVTGDEDADIEQYRATHPDFPHQSTGDQFFTEDQFESYRRLGYHIAKLAFRDAESGTNLVEIASKLYDVWTPGNSATPSFVKHTALLDQIWERFRSAVNLVPLLEELSADQLQTARSTPLKHEELTACLELIQLMENVFLDLRLDDFWNHPDNRGWAMLFSMWAKSPTFRAAWAQSRRTFGIRFEYFCHERLGLERDNPVMRVG